MLLKILTTAFVVTGVALILFLPVLMGQRPVHGTDKELANFGLRMLTYFGVSCAVWIGAAVCSVLLARKVRLQYLEEQRENVQELVKGTMKDHGRSE